jgi:RimJ/RimL family protein N-acetyltransferase
MRTGNINFRMLQEADLPLMHRWLNTPHVSEWYSISGRRSPSSEEIERKYRPRIHGSDPVDCYVIILENTPLGMVQSYGLDDFPAEKANFDLADKCVGIDIFIGEESHIHRGLGGLIIKEFLKKIVFEKYDVDCCIVDPYVENEIAIKAYRKAGFKYLKTVWNEAENRKEDILIIKRDEVRPGERKEEIKSRK